MNRAKWLVRTGMLILILGFFMPTMLVSCSGMTGLERSFSLADLASQADQPILYLFMFGALVAGVFSFLPYGNASDVKNFLLVQIAAVGTGLLGLLISLLSLSAQFQQGTFGMFEMRPDYGAFVLAGGLVLFAVGWFEQWANLGLSIINSPPRHRGESPRIPGTVEGPPQIMKDPAGDVAGKERVSLLARLEPVRGDLPRTAITVDRDDFTIGRGSDNSLVIHNTAVSRHHARLRCAQGAWFIQDTDSASGVVVNGEPTPATRLESGDEIEIAGNIFIFRC